MHRKYGKVLFMDFAKILEGLMLLAFGASWPMQIIKTVRVKNPTGKSFIFQYLIILGYLLGLASKAAAGNLIHWLTCVYLLDLALVLTDLILSHIYLARLKKKH